MPEYKEIETVELALCLTRPKLKLFLFPLPRPTREKRPDPKKNYRQIQFNIFFTSKTDRSSNVPVQNFEMH